MKSFTIMPMQFLVFSNSFFPKNSFSSCFQKNCLFISFIFLLFFSLIYIYLSNSVTSTTVSGMSRRDLPITDFVILSACSADSASKTFISKISPTRAVFAAINTLLKGLQDGRAGSGSDVDLNKVQFGVQALSSFRNRYPYRIISCLSSLTNQAASSTT